jgi:type VI secretion system Hcp family effector
MAIDVYMQIDGIKGESQDSTHQGWIELTSAHWGVVQPRSATVSTSGGHTAERCEHLTLSISKLADLSSPILMQTCSMGKTISKAKLEFMRADGDGKPVKYYEVELENVMLARNGNTCNRKSQAALEVQPWAAGISQQTRLCKLGRAHDEDENKRRSARKKKPLRTLASNYR